MHLSEALRKKYFEDRLPAREAQRLAEFIAWGPAIFQAARLLVKFCILDILRDSNDGLTTAEVTEKASLTNYATKCLLEAGLSMGAVLVNPETERYTLSKTGWFLLNDPATRVNMDFNHDVNYEGWFKLEESLRNGKPEGLRHFGSWPTIYEGLSSLPENVRKSWFGFDHFYSDSSFPDALKIVFDKHHVRTLYDVGGNTGKWALRCVDYDNSVEVTVFDLPQQIALMQQNVKGSKSCERIKGYGINLLDDSQQFPTMPDGPDAIWMSQFLDCFSMPQITGILKRAARAMHPASRIFIMETLWDRQKYEPATLCLTMTSLYFAALANGNSKMYNTDDMEQCINDAGLVIEEIYDNLGQGHTILVCKRKQEKQTNIE